jgi:hypothetical protein
MYVMLVNLMHVVNYRERALYYRNKLLFSGVHACVHGADALIN